MVPAGLKQGLGNGFLTSLASPKLAHSLHDGAGQGPNPLVVRTRRCQCQWPFPSRVFQLELCGLISFKDSFSPKSSENALCALTKLAEEPEEQLSTTPKPATASRLPHDGLSGPSHVQVENPSCLPDRE